MFYGPLVHKKTTWSAGPDNIQVVLQRWQRRMQRKNINKLLDRAERYVNISPRAATESIGIEASHVLESLRVLEISNIECDKEIQKNITDETELEKDLEISNIECDKEIQKNITDETELERDLEIPNIECDREIQKIIR